MPPEPTRSQQMGKLGSQFREQLIKAMAQVWGNRASDAAPLSHAEDLRLWMLPTSPAAVEAFKRGATLAEAEEANRLWAQEMKRQGATDEQVFQACRSHAFARGRANSKNDPALEAEYHAKMAQRAARARAPQMTYTDVPDPAREGVIGDASDDRTVY